MQTLMRKNLICKAFLTEMQTFQETNFPFKDRLFQSRKLILRFCVGIYAVNLQNLRKKLLFSLN